MNIGTQMKAIKVERLGGPAQPKIDTPKPVEVPVAATAKRELVTA